MKIKLPKLPGKRLNARGISHIAVPLALMVLMAIGGTYMVVSNRTNSLASIAGTTGGTPASTAKHKSKPKPAKKVKPAKKAKPAKSFIVVYSEKGAYDSIKIHALNPSGKLNCGGDVSSHDVTKSLSKSSQGSKISCSPTTGNEAYYVYFGKNKKITNHYVAVNITAGYCTLVHANASLMRQVPVQGSTCVGASSEADVPAKVDVTLNIGLKATKHGITGVVDLKTTNGDDISRVECVGDFSVQHDLVYPGGSMASYARRNYPWRFVSGSPSYCQARITNLQNVKAGNTYQVDGYTTGNAYFNAANANPVTITVPKGNGTNVVSLPN